MSDTPLISIIVPIYNTEKYVGDCIESILNQSFSDFELILVNDGSTDLSLEICKKYQCKDNRIKIIDKENCGVTKARKTGVEKSRGRYILFVDSDDTIPVDSISALVSYTNDEIDIVIGSYTVHKQDLELISPDRYIVRCIMGKIYPGPVGKLFKRSLFSESVLDIPRKIVKGEDMLMNIRISFNCKNGILIVPDVVYDYRQHDESCMAIFHSTVEYEGFFYKHMLLSIPDSKIKDYKPYVVHKAFEVWHDFYGYKYKLPDNYKSLELYQIIHDNISQYNKSINKFDCKLFEVTNIIHRFLLINLKRICIRITKVI